jgi:hypothetical protein
VDLRYEATACTAGYLTFDLGQKEESQSRWKKQAVATPARSGTQVTAVISLNQICQAATERDWGTQTGAPKTSTTRPKPTRLAACTVSRASRTVQDQHCQPRVTERARVPSRPSVHDCWARKGTCPSDGANRTPRGVERNAAPGADCRKNSRQMRRTVDG